MDAQASLIERVRAALASESSTREVSMFGGRSFMVDERMAVSARKQGDLLVRVTADRHDLHLARSGATTAVMGKDRAMGPGWISVDATAIASDTDLATWIGIALDEHRRALATPM